MSQFEFNPLTGKFDIIGGQIQTKTERLTLQAVAAEPISALRFVYVSESDGRVSIGSNSSFISSKVLGMALTAADTDASLTVLLFGKQDDAFFAGDFSEQYYLTPTGQATTTVPTTGTLTRVGYTLRPGSFFVKIEEPINLD